MTMPESPSPPESPDSEHPPRPPPAAVSEGEGVPPGALDGRMRTALAVVVALGILGTVGTFVVFDARAAMSFGVGALVAAANLYALAWLIGGLIGGSVDGETRASPTALSFLVVSKMLLLFGGAWFLMVKGLVEPLPLVCGYGILPLGIAIGALVSDMGDRDSSTKGP